MYNRRPFISSLLLVMLLITTNMSPLFADDIHHQFARALQEGSTVPADSDESVEPASEPLKGPIAIGSRDFTEQLLLGQLIAVALADAGFEIIDRTGLGGTNSAHDAIKNGEVDIIWDYIGTILSESHGVPPIGLPTDLETAFQMVAALDARHHDLLWLTPTAFNDTYTLMIKPETLNEKISQNLASLEDLAAYMNDNDAPLTICVENEFYSRGDGLFSLQEHYNFAFQEENIQIVGYDQLYEGLRDGLCDVAEGFSTDGRISAWGFQNLADTLFFFPAYNASPIVRADSLSQYPEIGDILNKISPLLDNATIAELNARIDIGEDGERNSGDEEAVADVAQEFLERVGIVAEAVKPKPTVAVGSRDFTEQLLLGQIIIVLLEDAGYNVIDKTGLGGTNSAHNAIETGEVDIIWDYIGTILSESHGVPPIGLPADTKTALEMVRGLDEHHHNLIWLTPTIFNDTYTLMIKPESLETKIGLSLATMEDLANYMNENDSPLAVCVENEFYTRGDGLYSLQNHYGFAFLEENIQIVGYDQLYEGLRDDLCDVAEGFSTDGRISAWGFQNLEDSTLFFPAYNASPIVRRELLADQPDIGELLDQLGPKLDNATVAELNARIDIGEDGERSSGDEESVRDVAYDFLFRNRLLSPPEIAVGSRDFTEQLLLGQILIGVLELSGFKAIDKTGLGGTNSTHMAIETGEVDIIWEYIGTILSESHGVPPVGLPADTDTAFQMVKGLDAHHHNLVWLAPTLFNDTYTLMIQPEALATKIGLELGSIEDLASYMNENNSALSICVENEFYSRGDGLYSLQEHYGFAFQEENIQIVAYDQLYEGLRDGLCDVAEGFSTDGRISAWGFQNLEDSTLFFPAYNASPIVRGEILDQYPELADLLNQLGGLLDNETVAALNARIDLGADGERNSGDEELVQDVAMSFLMTTALFNQEDDDETLTSTSADEEATSEEMSSESEALVAEVLAPPKPEFAQSGPLTGAEIVIASIDEQPQRLLGKALSILLQDLGLNVVESLDLGDSETIRQALADEEIDFYTDLPTSVLMEYHRLPTSTIPKAPDETIELVNRLERSQGVVWFAPLLLGTDYVALVKETLSLNGINSLDALAEFMQENDSPFSLCIPRSLFEEKENGLTALFRTYDFSFKPRNILVLEQNEIYEGLLNEQCEVAIAIGSEGWIESNNFTTLDDPQSFFRAAPSAFVTRQSLLTDASELDAYLSQLSERITPEVFQQMLAQIETGTDGVLATGDEELIDDVVRDFLCEEKLLYSCTGTDVAEVGSGSSTASITVEEETPNPAIDVDARVSPVITIPLEYSVNARQTTSTTASIIQVLEQGQTYPAIGKTDDNAWIQVQLEGEVAWVFTNAIFYSASLLSELPSITPPPLAVAGNGG